MYKSDAKLKVLFRNCFRNSFVNLSIQSIRRLLPNAEITCLNFYKHSEHEYDNREPINADSILYAKTKYPFMDVRINNAVFCEGFNVAYDLFKDCDDKILMLIEDRVFSTGLTLKEIIENEFDVALLSCGTSGVDATTAVFRFKRLKPYFPIYEGIESLVEPALYRNFASKIPKEKLRWFTTCTSGDFSQDGFCSNNINEIKDFLENLKAKT